jgi:hypothetical protein
MLIHFLLTCSPAKVFVSFLAANFFVQKRKKMDDSVMNSHVSTELTKIEELQEVKLSLKKKINISICLIYFGISQLSQVEFTGISEAKIQDINYQLGHINTVAPTTVVEDIGTNDLCNASTTAEDVGTRILRMCYNILDIESVKCVTIMKILTRGPGY